jgi:hypothetical protein
MTVPGTAPTGSASTAPGLGWPQDSGVPSPGLGWAQTPDAGSPQPSSTTPHTEADA